MAPCVTRSAGSSGGEAAEFVAAAAQLGVGGCIAEAKVRVAVGKYAAGDNQNAALDGGQGEGAAVGEPARDAWKDIEPAARALELELAGQQLADQVALGGIRAAVMRDVRIHRHERRMLDHRRCADIRKLL